MKPNLSPSSLRMSAEALRYYATPENDIEIESIPPILLESRRAVLSVIALELDALALERDLPSRRWWHRWA